MPDIKRYLTYEQTIDLLARCFKELEISGYINKGGADAAMVVLEGERKKLEGGRNDG